MTNSNDLAFARPTFYHPEGGVSHSQDGCTKREHFAAMAMQGLLANIVMGNKDEEFITKLAVIYADELINALNQSKWKIKS